MKLSLIIAYTYSVDIFRLIGLIKLMSSIKNQLYRDFETILVEDTQGTGISKFPFKKDVNLVIPITDPENRKFNKSWVMNVGAKNARYNGMVFIDAEISFGNDYLNKIIEGTQKYEFFNGWSEYVCMSGRDNPKERRHYWPKTIRAMIGSFYSTKDFYFHKLGGYNENYFGYGAEDNDICYRAKYVLEKDEIKKNNFDFFYEEYSPIPMINYTIYHNYHHWHPSTGPDPLNPDREKILNVTIKRPQEVINKLVTTNIGNFKHPTLINL